MAVLGISIRNDTSQHLNPFATSTFFSTIPPEKAKDLENDEDTLVLRVDGTDDWENGELYYLKVHLQ